MALPALDLWILVAWLAATVLAGLACAGRKGDVTDWILAGRALPTWALLLSIVATETSTVTFLSVPSLAYRGDWTFLQLAFGYVAGRILVAWWLLPRYFQGGVLTAYETLDRSFEPSVRRTASTVFQLARTLGDGLRLFLGAIVLQKVAGIGFAPAVWALGIATMAFTLQGGMRAVVWTDVMQFAVYVAGAVAALWTIGSALPGGLGPAFAEARASGGLRILDPSFDLSEPFSAWTAIAGGAVLSVGTHGVDQMFVQRYLCAPSLAAARRALVASGVVVAVQFALFLAIGTALAAWSASFAPPLELERDEEFASFIVNGMPTGLRGIVLGAVFAAAISTLSSSLGSSATAFVHDLWPGPRAAEAARWRAARAATLAFGLAQVAVALLGPHLRLGIVSHVLAIAGFATGLLLGLFALATRASAGGADPLSRARASRAALAGLGIGLAVVCGVHFWTPLAWPWYALVGALGTYAGGLLAGALAPALGERGA